MSSSIPPRRSARLGNAKAAKDKASESIEAVAETFSGRARKRARREPKRRELSPALRVERRNQITTRTNDCGLLNLPAELLDEIIQSIPVFEVTTSMHFLSAPLDLPDTQDRRLAVLRALSQTCKYLRQHTLHLAWERIEVFSSAYTAPRQWMKDVALRLIRQLKAATNTPALGEQVKSVTLYWTGYSPRSCSRGIAVYLSQLPNLKNLIIVGPSGSADHFKSAFHGLNLPSIESLVIPPFAIQLASSCPVVVSLKVLADNYVPESEEFLEELAASCPKLLHLEGFNLWSSVIFTTFGARSIIKQIHELIQQNQTK